VRAASFDEVRAFFRTHYVPSNASLVVAGDVTVADAIERVRRCFDEIPAAAAPGPVTVPAPSPQERLLFMEDAVELPRLYMAWHSPAMFAPGDAEMDLLADLVGNGKVSRLYRALVYERQIATEVAAAQNSQELAGFWELVATAAPGHSLEELEAGIEAELSRLIDEGPTAEEMERGRAQAEAQFVYRLQTLGGFGGRSDQLNAYNVFLGDPGYFERDLARYRSASRSRLHDAARTCLPRSGRVAVSVVPRGRPKLALPGSAPVVIS